MAMRDGRLVVCVLACWFVYKLSLRSVSRPYISMSYSVYTSVCEKTHTKIHSHTHTHTHTSHSLFCTRLNRPSDRQTNTHTHTHTDEAMTFKTLGTLLPHCGKQLVHFYTILLDHLYAIKYKLSFIMYMCVFLSLVLELFVILQLI